MVNKTSIMTRRVVSLLLAVLIGATTVVSGGRGRIPAPHFFYVDTRRGNDNNEELTPGSAFATIQRGIDAAADGDTVLVCVLALSNMVTEVYMGNPGLYFFMRRHNHV